MPLFHQIVESVRYQIATGQLTPGDKLPTLRDGSQRWNVNLHTVRRAYGELAQAGLVVVRRAQGTRVVDGAGGRPKHIANKGLDAFLTETSRQARDRFGLNEIQLAGLLRARGRGGESPDGLPAATFVECSNLQAADYADQIMARWAVSVRSSSLHQSKEPAPGPILSTYFHFNNVRARWPARHGDLHFLPVQVDRGLIEQLSRRRSARGRPRIVIAEANRARAQDIVGDLMTLLPSRQFSIVTRVSRRPGDLLRKRNAGAAVLFAPRLWSRLTQEQRSHPKAVQIRYVIEPSALSSLGKQKNWSLRGNIEMRA